MQTITYHLFGALALFIYVAAFFLKKGRHPIVRAAVNLLFALMFGTLQAFAPMVIYLFNAFFAIVPVYKLSIKLGLSARINVVIFQGIPAACAIALGILAAKTQNASPLGIVITFSFPVIAILLNLAVAFVGASGKRWSLAPLVRSIVWIVYFIVAGIWVSIVYEIFNLVIYIKALKHTGNLPILSFKKREKLPEDLIGVGTSRRSGSTSNTRPASSAPSVSLGNNVMSFESDGKNVANDSFVPTVFKGQW